MTILRLTLHVLAASIWVGGQFVVAGLMPTVRGLGADAPRRVARVFGRLSWPAYWTLVATGLWNYAALQGTATHAWQMVFGMKMMLVAVAGVTTFLHTRAKTPSTRGALAGAASLASIAALVLGVAIAG